MVKKTNKQNISKQICDEFKWNEKTIATFFLGVGFILFILNLTTVMKALDMIARGFPVTSFYTSIASSMVLMSYSIYNIYKRS